MLLTGKAKKDFLRFIYNTSEDDMRCSFMTGIPQDRLATDIIDKWDENKINMECFYFLNKKLPDNGFKWISKDFVHNITSLQEMNRNYNYGH